MYESDLEAIILKYPQILEEGLEHGQRQVPLGGKRADLIFQDSQGKRLVIELKMGTVKREHVGQLIEYFGTLLKEQRGAIRAMLVGVHVPLSLQAALDHFGIEWKEIDSAQVASFLISKGEEELAQAVLTLEPIETLSKSGRGRSLSEPIRAEEAVQLVDQVIEAALKPLGKRITATMGHRYTSYFLDGARFAHFYDRSPTRIQLHLDKRYLQRIGKRFDKSVLAAAMRVGETKDDYPIYIDSSTDLAVLAKCLMQLYG